MYGIYKINGTIYYKNKCHFSSSKDIYIHKSQMDYDILYSYKNKYKKAYTF